MGKIGLSEEEAKNHLIITPDLEKASRTVILNEALFKALLYSHLLFVPFRFWEQEIEDVTYDKEKKQIIITFKRSE